MELGTNIDAKTNFNITFLVEMVPLSVDRKLLIGFQASDLARFSVPKIKLDEQARLSVPKAYVPRGRSLPTIEFKIYKEKKHNPMAGKFLDTEIQRFLGQKRLDLYAKGGGVYNWTGIGLVGLTRSRILS